MVVTLYQALWGCFPWTAVDCGNTFNPLKCPIPYTIISPILQIRELRHRQLK